MKVLIKKCEEHSIENYYRYNVKKCVIFKSDTEAQIKIYEEIIPESCSFEYLGYTFDHKGINSNKHIQRISEKVDAASRYMYSLGLNFRDFEPKTNVTLFKSFIRSKLEYGLAITTPTKGLMKKINSVQHRAICRMSCIQSQGTAADTIHLLYGLTEMEQRAKILRSKYLLRMQFLNQNEEFLVKVLVSKDKK